MAEEQARAPVVTISCPSCGGKVRGAEPGSSSDCRYCGTTLHIPHIGDDDDEPVSDRASAQEEVAGLERAKPPPVVVFAVVAFFALVVVIIVRIAITVPEVELDAPAAPESPTMRSARCLSDCTDDCGRPGDDMASMDAYAECTQRCVERCE